MRWATTSTRSTFGAGRTATAIAAGDFHTCALLDNGTVKCWGANDVGQLGQGDTDSRGDSAGEMGDDLDPVDLGAGRTAVAIAAGGVHTCALLDDGAVKCWGDSALRAARPGRHATCRGDDAGEMGDDLDPVGLGAGRTAVAIAAGDVHTCALLDNGIVKCWGFNLDGELGYGDTDARGDGAGEMGDFLGPVGLGAGRTAVAITAGDFHTCALLDDDTVKCWGYNIVGQLGYGDTDNRGDGAGEMGDDLDPVDLGAGRTATRSPPAISTRVRCSTTTRSSAGGGTSSGSSATATRSTAATMPARWETAWHPCCCTAR